MIIAYISVMLFAGYAVLIFYYWLGWRSVPEYRASKGFYTTQVTVIVPARNEEEHIGVLLASLQNQTYPAHLFEIIVVNDHSADRTADVVKQFPRVILLDLRNAILNSYKKKAIELGVATSSGKLIVTTDADCRPSPTWLATLVSFYEEKKSVFIAAPVIFSQPRSGIELFQSIDFLVLQGITAASVYKGAHSMCNGANLAYEKKAFEEVGGFAGVEAIASGDDMLLMYKISKKFPGRSHYLKSPHAIVITEPMKTWKDFFNQRARWASKATHYDDTRITAALCLVYLFNFSFLVILVGGFWFPFLWWWLIVLLIAKTLVELPFVYSITKYFDQRYLLNYFFLFQPLHIFYTIMAGWLGQFGRYKWKGRLIR